MKKNKIIIVSIVSLIILNALFLSFNMFAKDSVVVESKKKKKDHNDSIAMMLETSYNSKNYQESTTNSWPSSGYVFNETLSRCENGSEISYDVSTNKVTIIGDTNDKCYVYFDNLKSTLANYVKGLCTTQGANNLYHHDGTLENGIDDGSYRYSGIYESVSNWVCFGSTAATCPSSNLYRIIGVFNEKNVNTGETESRVKLIMNDYPGESVLGKAPGVASVERGDHFTGPGLPDYDVPGYYWSGSSSNTSNNWGDSTFNTNTLNGTYLTKLGTEWTNKIATTEWKTGGNTRDNIGSVKAATAYQNEIVNNVADGDGKRVANAKVGLMYVSDYGFAEVKDNWGNAMYNNSNYTSQSTNWLLRGVWEWTITRYSDNLNGAFNVRPDGFVDYDYDVYYADLAVRPVFYLETNVGYASGKGTQTNPIRIS